MCIINSGNLYGLNSLLLIVYVSLIFTSFQLQNIKFEKVLNQLSISTLYSCYLLAVNIFPKICCQIQLQNFEFGNWINFSWYLKMPLFVKKNWHFCHFCGGKIVYYTVICICKWWKILVLILACTKSYNYC